jgi:glucokinase
MTLNHLKTLGIDIGGTNIDLGLVAAGQLLEKKSFEVDNFKDRQELLNQLITTIGSFDLKGVRGIGIGVPGIIDPIKGYIYDLQNLPMWYQLPLADILTKEFSLPVKLNNDAGCCALGHAHYGQGRLHKNFVVLTLGTGLGMGIIINGTLYSGMMAGAGEIGMIPYQAGIVEDYAASAFFVRHYGQSARALYDQARQNSEMAVEAFHQYGLHLGNAIKIVMSMYAPEAIIIGGAIAKAYPFFWQSMKKAISDFEYTQQLENTVVVAAQHQDMGVMGAAALIAP